MILPKFQLIIMMQFIFWTWCFPQQLLGCIIRNLFYNKIKYTEKYKHANVYWIDWIYGVSLGSFILIDAYFKKDNTIKMHEYGHTLQSLILGPLYLIVVGLPSIIMNIVSRYDAKFSMGYYKRFPEDWADSLGGVKR